MTRYDEVDILKGIAVVCMIIFHIYYFPAQYGYTEFNYQTTSLKIIAKVAQIIFITCVGINMYISYKNSKEKKEDTKVYIKKQLTRIGKLLVCALFMTVFSYYVFGDKFIKFGILHFIAFGSLCLFMFVDKPTIIIGVLTLISLLYTLKNINPSLFMNVPPKIAFISGFYSNWSAIDHFPIIPWLIYICIGILLGNIFYDKYNQYRPTIENKYKKLVTPLQEIGKKSLEVYLIHWIILYIFFAHIYPVYKEKIFMNSITV